MIKSLGLIPKIPEPLLDAPRSTAKIAENGSGLSLRDIPLEEVSAEFLNRIVFHADPNGLAADRFRYMRMRLQEFSKGGKLKKLLVTSPLPQDGKSTLVLNLSTALAERGQTSVLLVEADLYNPALIPLLALTPGPGLSECLADGVDPLSIIRHVGSLGWYLLPAGRPPENPAELLHGDLVPRILQSLTTHFDWIIIDSPPVTLLTDALAVARHADASLVVVRAGQTPQAAVTAALAALGPKHVLGVVLNGVEGLEKRYSKYHGYYRKSSQ